MAERRSLSDGIKPRELTEAEREFVKHGDKTPEQPAPADPSAHTPESGQAVLRKTAARVPVSARCRPEIASELKRCALQRELNDEKPYQIQEIVEQALEDWLKRHGCLLGN